MADEELGGQQDGAPAAEARREPTAEEREAMRRFEEEMGRLTVVDHVELMLRSLSSLAVDRLGMGEGGPARRDLEQARTAIDAFRALLGVLEGKVAAERSGAHRAALAQMQMAFVSMTAPAPTPEPAPKAEDGSSRDA
jgi:hypothetical protein